MKRLTIVFATLIIAAQAIAQEVRPAPRTVSVSGSSQIEIVPDEIYVQVDLREYNKKNGDKIDINSIKNNFLAACKSIGLTDKDVAVQSYQGYDNNYWMIKKNRKQNPDLKASISYWVKASNTEKLDDLVDKMDDEATQNFFIAKASYSKMDELKKELKIAAVKAAREKAIYLSEAIGEHIGEAITINDPAEINNYPQPYYANVTMQRAVAADNAEPPMNVDFKKIKIQFEVSVVFALK
ncbi:MAG TPA: SIMPL domain-containing protein [Panacibacter sp.]|nr:SIMPL domain-containing protein [Panacibacter sp.]